MLKVAINGGGRIGRACARILLERSDVHLVAIADLMPADQLLHLLRFDSTHGSLPTAITPLAQGFLSQNGQTRLIQSDADTIVDFAALGAEVLLECSGHFLTAAHHQAGLDAGLKGVIFSAIALDATPVVLPGLSSSGAQRVVSAGSCTTNALALLSAGLSSQLELRGVLATSIHSYTADQRLLDGTHPHEKRRGRAAGLNIIPTVTMAAQNLPRLLASAPPAGAIGLRVPLANVCMMQAVFALEKPTSAAEVNTVLQRFSDQIPPGVLGISWDSKVSSDMIGDRHSAIVDAPLTQCVGNMVQVCAWHDNEYGYASRVVDLALTIL